MSTVHRAVLLAAGRGKRMMPLTANLPKPLIPVAGQPILERILMALRNAGIDEAVIVHGYLGHMIEEYFGDGSRLGMHIEYRVQDPPNGTAGALLFVEEWCGSEPFMLHWGDILVSPSNYFALLARYNNAPTPPACVLGMNWVEDPTSGAAVYRDETGQVTALIEKPEPGTSATNWNNAGVMALGPQVWKYLHQVTPSPRGEYEFTDVLHLLIQNKELLIGHELKGLWSDVGTPEVVDRMNADSRFTRWYDE